MNNVTWIKTAIRAGGTLTVSKIAPRRRKMVARMSWPGEETITGVATDDFESALANLDSLLLDSLLQDDAADEMIRKGAA